MHPIFIARGPAFKKNYVAEPFETINIYALMCHLLGINPRPNNGSVDAVRHILVSDVYHSAFISALIVCDSTGKS
jgi:ectonucleotide pyrophosphatase/phosphodiesterase family protein 7